MYNGQKIRELLREKGIKQKELLAAMGWKNSNQLRQVIEGNPRADILEGICDFLEIPMDELFIRTDYSVKSNVEKLQIDIMEQQKQTIDSLYGLLKIINR